MLKTKLNTKSKVIIEKETVNFGNKNEKSNSISKRSFLNSKIKEMEIHKFSSIISRNKSFLKNKKFRSRGKSIEKSEKIIEKNKKVRNNYFNKSTKKNNINNNIQNEKLHLKLLKKKEKRKN